MKMFKMWTIWKNLHDFEVYKLSYKKNYKPSIVI